MGQGGAGPDHAHRGAHDVEELGQLVQAGRPQEPPDPRDAGVVLHFEQRAVALVLGQQIAQPDLGVDRHGAELEQRERLAVSPDPGLAEEHGATVLGLHGEGHQQEDRRKQDEKGKRDREVQAALDAQLGG
jgi:hypothetical protein